MGGKMKKLKYVHPAACGYNTKKVYQLDELMQELNINMIKILFEPINFTWDDLETHNNKSILKKTLNARKDGAEN